jgi:hypothetical protein
MRSWIKLLLAGVLAFGMTAGSASAVNFTRAEFNAFFAVPRVITLGGPGQDYIGALIVIRTGVNASGNALGTGRGVAIISGTPKNIVGTWVIKGNQFCRKWTNFDGGQEICETWTYLTWNSANVVVGGALIGVNSW